MSTISLHDKKFERYIEADALQEAVTRIANQLKSDYAGKTPVFLIVLQGAFRFAADLVGQYPGDCTLSFLRMRSYEGFTSEKVKAVMDITDDLEGKDVIVVEDIVDSGQTWQKLHKLITERKAASVSIATLFLKPALYKGDLPVNYPGIEIGDAFIVGYGLDYMELGRNLPCIYRFAGNG